MAGCHGWTPASYFTSVSARAVEEAPLYTQENRGHIAMDVFNKTFLGRCNSSSLMNLSPTHVTAEHIALV